MTSSFGKCKHVYCTSSRKIHLLCAQRRVLWSPEHFGLCRLADPAARQCGGHQVCRARPSTSHPASVLLPSVLSTAVRRRHRS